jgi:hypothetical protein
MSSQYKGNFIGDVFFLSTVYDTQIKNVEDGNFASWPESAIYGYLVGGGTGTTPTGSSTITRLNLSNETFSDPGNTLPVGRNNIEGLANAINSYFGGGFFNPPTTGTYVSTITRQNFSNETVTNPGNNLPVARSNITATSSSSFGYFGGGFNAAPAEVSTISRINFSNETVNNTTNLPLARADRSATSSSSYGYFGGGGSFSTVTSTISRLNFATETINNTTNLSVARGTLFTVETRSYGYFCGGATPTFISTIDRLDFSNETISNPGNLLSVRRGSATSSSNSYGYFCGGSGPPGSPSFATNVNRFDFSVETISDLGNIIPRGIGAAASVSGGQSV